MNPAELRGILFDRYSRQLSTYLPEHKDVFCCPLCGRLFDKRSLLHPPALTLAHVISEALGGSLTTLCCADCNSQGGASSEIHLMNRFALEDELAGYTSLANVRLRTPVGDMGVEVDWNRVDNAVSIRPVAKQSNPVTLQHFQRYLSDLADSETTDWNMKLDWRRIQVSPKRATTAVYQSAYLLLFTYFGYEYMFNPQMLKLRERLLNPDSEEWQTNVAVLPDGDIPQGDNFAVQFCRAPKCIMAILRFSPNRGRSRLLGVSLPPPSGEWEPLRDRTSFQGTTIPLNQAFLLSQKWSAYHLWQLTRTPLD